MAFPLYLIAGLALVLDPVAPARAAEPPSAAKPALTVRLVRPQQEDWPQTLAANGNIVAWQEAVIGAEVAGQRLAEVRVNVGDAVKKGQLLARVASDSVAAEAAQGRAAVAEAEAALAEARAHAERGRRLREQGFYSAQQALQLQTAEQSAQARLAAAQARLEADELRLAQTRIVAPDAGTISARTATVGSLTQPGQELFRLVRGNRLEWRAEVVAAELARIRPGTAAALTLPGQTARVEGRVRVVAPTVDAQTRNGLVYVDLPAGSAARAGMYARGEFTLGRRPALTVPQSAVLLREGFAYVFRVEAGRRAAQAKVQVGRRQGERVEILAGLDASTAVVESGVGFLADGDTVRVVGP